MLSGAEFHLSSHFYTTEQYAPTDKVGSSGNGTVDRGLGGVFGRS